MWQQWSGHSSCIYQNERAGEQDVLELGRRAVAESRPSAFERLDDVTGDVVRRIGLAEDVEGQEALAVAEVDVEQPLRAPKWWK